MEFLAHAFQLKYNISATCKNKHDIVSILHRQQRFFCATVNIYSGSLEDNQLLIRKSKIFFRFYRDSFLVHWHRQIADNMKGNFIFIRIKLCYGIVNGDYIFELWKNKALNAFPYPVSKFSSFQFGHSG